MMLKQLYLYLTVLLLTFASCGPKYNLSRNNHNRIITGLENFVDNYADGYRGKRAAIVTNHSGLDFNLENNINLIREKGIEIVLLLAPEHGLYGYQNEYEKEKYNIDNVVNVIVYNLHRLNHKSLSHLLKVTDFVIFDMQDMGMRCYTYISSLKFIMDTLSGTEKELVVLDRPNPLGFLSISGPYLEDNFFSRHISSFPATLFYDMTIGEAALYYKGEYAKNLKLNVIRMKGYRREMFYNDTMLPWIPPSPNLPTYESSIIYSGVVLLEGINISLGRGTTKPFEYIGAPWIEPVSFCKGLSDLNFNNFVFRPVYFEPTFSKYKNEKCGGAQIIYTGGSFDPVEVSFKLISYIRQNYPEFKWESYTNNTFSVDFLAGTDKFRKTLSARQDFSLLLKEIEKQSNSFSKKRKKYLIYFNNYIPI